jgi:hypothetical protein
MKPDVPTTDTHRESLSPYGISAANDPTIRIQLEKLNKGVSEKATQVLEQQRGSAH